MNSLVADAAGLDLFLSYLNFPFVFLISLNILKLFFILLIIMPESVSCGTLQLFVENLGSLSTSSFSSSELEPIPGMWPMSSSAPPAHTPSSPFSVCT